ncbi:MAG: helix-turn-helix domain-containing protein [Gammaproteobacteria bacterium]|nr:helix-turn-helix domain-containing protein [Gammaproteobacteria bacterium]MCY4356550.1 helix-turn-helix domain-containing protein [Gammaproteobacteria bacterium]
MKNIAILVLPRALGSSISIPLEMLSAANDIALARKQKAKLNAIQLVGPHKGAQILSGGMRVDCHNTISEAELKHLIFIPGLWRKPTQAVRQYPAITQWLRQQYESGATVCAVAGGAFFAAEAGLLDDRSATTHWRYFHEFASTYTRVKLQRKRFTTCADRVYCTGSVNAIRDIMLHFIGNYYDTNIANEIAQHFTHELKPSFESELLGRDRHSAHYDELIIAVQEWFMNHFQQQVTVAEVAKHFGLSVRSLNRRFRQATDTTPLSYLQSLRLEHAKQLLKQSNLVIAEVAGTVGYQDTSYFSEVFRRSNAMTPNEYRQLVRNKLFVAEHCQAET